MRSVCIPASIERGKGQRHYNATASLFLLTLLVSTQSASSLQTSASFDAAGNEEYDFATLDPDSPFGSPYGGFSRATGARLSSLPLKLPNVADKLDEFEPFFLRVMDSTGRSFSCRAYHEDELDPTTLDEGMFEPPILLDAKRVDEKEISRTKNGQMNNARNTQKSDDNVEDRLAQLDGICAQIHQGWWSYEWCYEGRVTQFHVKIEGLGKQNQVFKVEDVTSLGDFKRRRTTSPKMEEVEHNRYEHGTTSVDVFQEFLGGGICLETGKHRETTAHMTCCAPSSAAKNKGTVLYKGEPFETDLVYIQAVAESKKEMCKYTINVCTPLLCDDGTSSRKKNQKLAQLTASDSRLDNEAQEIQKLSISDILDMTFGTRQKKCIQFGTGAWWVYELCPGKYIRQFHEVTLLDRVSGTSTTAIEMEHILGRFNPLLRLPKEKEWENVVNTTTVHTGTQSKSKTRSRTPVIHGGNGAFFFQEYTGGDVCDHADVTGSAIKAGEVGEGLIQRSTKVKYGCGSHVEMTVKEDSTCHYVAHITVPLLCHHPLFRSPVEKKQVIKCLPDDEKTR